MSDDCCGICNLPEGTAYITPDHAIGVVSRGEGGARPLEGANMDALYALQDAIRRESARR